MRKAVGMMAGLSEEYRRIWGAGGRLVDPGSPKISRGENYLGLPWVMLDYPRVFGREDVLAIRTFFWWGHHFSVTLHLKGCWLDLCLPVIAGRRGELAAAGFHVGISDDEWRHEHVADNYQALGGPGGSDGLTGGGGLTGGRGFLKLSSAVDLNRWDEAPSLLKGSFGVLAGILADDQLPSR